jgi:hypothetical protein
MAKKNIFSIGDLAKIKEEIDKSLSELAGLSIEDATDEMDWRSGVNGTKTPYIISSIEDKFKTAMVVIIDSVEQLKVIHTEEGYSKYVASKVLILENKLGQIQDYFEKRMYSDVSHRFLEKEHIGARGKVISLRLEAATKEEQVKTRSTIQKQIFRIIPMLNTLKSVSGEEIQIKGKKDVPISLKGLV